MTNTLIEEEFDKMIRIKFILCSDPKNQTYGQVLKLFSFVYDKFQVIAGNFKLFNKNISKSKSLLHFIMKLRLLLNNAYTKYLLLEKQEKQQEENNKYKNSKESLLKSNETNIFIEKCLNRIFRKPKAV